MTEKPHRVNGHRFNINLSKGKKTWQKTNKNHVFEAFQGLPGPNSRLFMGCQAAELNHFAKPFKMGLQLTNRHFNFDKFRVFKRLTCQTFSGSCQGYLDRSGLLDEGMLTQGFRWIHQASKPCLIAYYKGPFKLFVAVHKEPPSNFVSCAHGCLCLSCA